MFREMRRKKQLLSKKETEKILKSNTAGVLGVIGDEGYPYTVPLSYVYYDSKIYFHCAKSGHKLDAIMENNKVSFCVIDQDQIVPEEYTTYFRSVIAFGKARILEGEEMKRAITILGNKYSPNDEEGVQKEIQGALKQLCVIEIAIEHLTGKEAIELVKNK